MTPAEHYAKAEDVVAKVVDEGPSIGGWTTSELVLIGLTHAVLAVAGELGVPTGSTHTGKQATT